MGTCLGRCLSRKDKQYLSNQNSFHDFTYLVGKDNSGYEENQRDRNFLIKFFAKRGSKNKKPVLEFIDDILSPHYTAYNRLQQNQQLSGSSSYNGKDIQLQYLDAKALLAHTTMSTPPSSLDLEWEHEPLPISIVQDISGYSWSVLPYATENGDMESMTRNLANTNSDWSRISSPNSLEWDNVPTSIQGSPPNSDLDTDTQLLLSEIERLTSQTLQETGKDLFS